MKSYDFNQRQILGVRGCGGWDGGSADKQPGLEPQLCHFLHNDLRQVISLSILTMDQMGITAYLRRGWPERVKCLVYSKYLVISTVLTFLNYFLSSIQIFQEATEIHDNWKKVLSILKTSNVSDEHNYSEKTQVGFLGRWVQRRSYLKWTRFTKKKKKKSEIFAKMWSWSSVCHETKQKQNHSMK